MGTIAFNTNPDIYANLTDRQARFVRAYTTNGYNATAAAVKGKARLFGYDQDRQVVSESPISRMTMDEMGEYLELSVQAMKMRQSSGNSQPVEVDSTVQSPEAENPLP